MESSVVDPRWKSIYKIGGVAALIVVILWSIEIIGVIKMGTPPSTVIGWFTHYQQYGLLGLFDSFLLDVLANIFMIPVFIALYIALKQTSASAITIATTLGLVGITLSFTTNVTLAMLSLSNQYAAATTEAQRTLIITTGQALLEIGQHGTGSTMSYLLYGIAGLIISIVMLQSQTFSKATAFAGILANISQVIQPPVVFAPANFYDGKGLGILLMMVSFVFYVIWYILVAWSLFRLGRIERNK